MGAKTDMTLFLASTMHFCIITIVLLSINFLLEVDTCLPRKNTIPLQSAVVPTGLRNNTIYSFPLLWYSLVSPTNTIPHLLRCTQRPKLTPPPSFAVVSTGLLCHFVVITHHTHMQGFRATCTLAPYCSLIWSVLTVSVVRLHCLLVHAWQAFMLLWDHGLFVRPACTGPFGQLNIKLRELNCSM